MKLMLITEKLCCILPICEFAGQTRIFNESEMYQRAFLHWNRAAIQGNVTLTEIYIQALYMFIAVNRKHLNSEVMSLCTVSLDNFGS